MSLEFSKISGRSLSPMGGIKIKKRIFILVLFSLSLFWTNLSFADVKSQALLLHEKGKISFSSGDYEKALDLFEESKKLDSEIKENFYWMGLVYLKQEKFSQAEEQFKELIARDPNYKKAYFDYGLSLFRQGKYAEALPWFEKQSGQKENPLPLFYAGLTHYYLNQEAESLSLLKKVVSLFPSSETATGAKEWIAKIESKEVVPMKLKAKRWSLGASAGFYYDSNVIRDPEDENLAGFTNQEDYAVISNLNLKYLLVAGDKTKLSAEYAGYQSAYLNRKFDSNDFNYGRHRGGLVTTRKLTDYAQLRFPLYYTFAMLGKAKYFQSGAGETTIDLVWMKNFLSSFTGGAKKDWFFGTFTNANQQRTAIQPYAKFEQYFFAPNNKDLYFRAGYGFENNIADGADWDYQSHLVYAGLQTPFFWKTRFLLSTETIARRIFANIDSIFGIQRVDKAGTLTGVLSKDILPHLTTSLSYTFAIQSSTITRFNYKRHVAGLTFSTKW